MPQPVRPGALPPTMGPMGASAPAPTERAFPWFLAVVVAATIVVIKRGERL